MGVGRGHWPARWDGCRADGAAVDARRGRRVCNRFLAPRWPEPDRGTAAHRGQPEERGAVAAKRVCLGDGVSAAKVAGVRDPSAFADPRIRGKPWHWRPGPSGRGLWRDVAHATSHHAALPGRIPPSETAFSTKIVRALEGGGLCSSRAGQGGGGPSEKPCPKVTQLCPRTDSGGLRRFVQSPRCQVWNKNDSSGEKRTKENFRPNGPPFSDWDHRAIPTSHTTAFPFRIVCPQPLRSCPLAIPRGVPASPTPARLCATCGAEAAAPNARRGAPPPPSGCAVWAAVSSLFGFERSARPARATTSRHCDTASSSAPRRACISPRSNSPSSTRCRSSRASLQLHIPHLAPGHDVCTCRQDATRPRFARILFNAHSHPTFGGTDRCA